MRTILMVTMLAGAVGTAGAAETTMGETQLDALLTGNTVYIEVPPGGPGGPTGGIAPFKYGADGSAAARLPSGMTLVGTWRIDGDSYCVDWDNGPKNSCTSLVKSDGAIALMDTQAGERRGTVQRIVPGNPEEL